MQVMALKDMGVGLQDVASYTRAQACTALSCRRRRPNALPARGANQIQRSREAGVPACLPPRIKLAGLSDAGVPKLTCLLMVS